MNETLAELTASLRRVQDYHKTFHLIRDGYGKHVLQCRAERLFPRGQVDLGTGLIAHQEKTAW